MKSLMATTREVYDTKYSGHSVEGLDDDIVFLAGGANGIAKCN
jgi:hypothetical protein